MLPALKAPSLLATPGSFSLFAIGQLPFPLSNPTTVGPPGPCATRSSVGDLNGDGRDDFVGGGAGLSVMCSLAGGGYGPPVPFGPTITAGASVNVHAVADMNVDGIADVLMTVEAPLTGLFSPPLTPPVTMVLPGLGNCLFGAALPVPDPTGATSWRRACFLNPYIPGLVAPGMPPAIVMVSWQGCANAQPHFVHTLTYAAGAYSAVASTPAPIPPAFATWGPLATFSIQRAGDVDGDGLLDLVGNSQCFAYPQLVLARGSAIPPYFVNPTSVAMSSGFANLAVEVSDVNNDGLADVVYVDAYGTVVAFFGHPTSPLTAFQVSSVGAPIQSFFVQDLDGDGAADFFFRSYGATSVGFSRGNGLGAFGPAMTVPASASHTSSCAWPADENGDGSMDFVAALLPGITGARTFAMHNLSRFGPGVPGSNAVVPQAVSGIANAGAVSYFVGIVGAAGNAPAILGVSLGALTTPDTAGNMLDLNLLVLPSGNFGSFQTDASGNATWTLTLPPLPALVGQTIFLEWFVHDTGATAGYGLSPARKVVFW